MIHIPDDWDAGFGPGAGFLDVATALHAMADSARKAGVEMIPGVAVTSWAASEQGVSVTAGATRYDGDALIVTAGAWAGRIFKDLNLPLAIQRKVQWWLKTEAPSLYAPDRFPIFITDSEQGQIYGFPTFLSPGIKIGNHAGGEPTDPDQVDRTVSDDEKRGVTGFASWFFEGVTARVLQTSVCLYARTPDEHFILDRHPIWPNVVIGAGFSGHGFKFTPAVGEHLVSLALDAKEPPHRLFRLNRF
jgi:glycine/D-amino acid oxidase-like deaminating enzyme